MFLYLITFLMMRHIHLTSENRFERFLTLFFQTAIHLIAVIKKFLDTEHISMVGDGHTAHAVGTGLVHELLDASLTVKNRLISMDVKMNKILHIDYFLCFESVELLLIVDITKETRQK